MSAAELPPDSYDSPWKEVVDVYFPELLALFFPEIHADVDWSRGYQSLDKELVQVVRDAELGTRLADKLFKVWRHNGSPRIVYLNVEVQGEREADFPQRLFVYYYRIYDRFGDAVVTLAILADANPEWRPERYASSEIWGTSVELRFRTVKLWDYNSRWEELLRSPNPFAVVVAAYLKTKTTRQAPEERLRFKLRLTRHLYERGYARQDVLELFWFIDWVMHLPKPLDLRFKDEMDRYEEEKNVRYVTSIERLSREEGLQEGLQEGHQEGRQEGLQEGLQEGRQEGALSLFERLLRRRFVELPGWVRERLEQATREEIERWSERLLDARRLEDVFSSS